MKEDKGIPFNFSVFDTEKCKYIKPTFCETLNHTKEYYMFGKKNDTPQRLLEIYQNKSNKHRAIIDKKIDMIAANGFKEVENPSDEYIKFVSNVHSDDGNLEDVTFMAGGDQEIQDGYAFMITWSNESILKDSNVTKIAQIDHLPWEKVRVGSEKGKYWLSPDWENVRKAGNTPVEFQGFSVSKRKEFPVQIVYYTIKTPGRDIYPLVYYKPGLPWILSDKSIGEFHNTSIENGFSAGYMLNLSTGSIPTPEEMEIIEEKFQEKFAGTSNANRVIITFSINKDTQATLTPIELNSSDQRYIDLSNQIKEEIFISHRVTSPVLFGVTSQSIFGNDEQAEALENFQASYIRFRQRHLENTLNRLAKINGVVEEIKLERYLLNIEEEEKENNNQNEN